MVKLLVMVVEFGVTFLENGFQEKTECGFEAGTLLCVRVRRESVVLLHACVEC